MSRFYDALTSANRVRPGLDLGVQLGSRKGKFPEIEIPPVQTTIKTVIPTPDVGEEGGNAETVAVQVQAPPPEEAPPAGPKSGLNRSLGTHTVLSLDRKARLIPHATDKSVVEHYRRLRTKIMQKRDEMRFQTLLVTSPNPQEGKTVTVANLGLSFAMLPGFKVLIVDGDLRRGSLAHWLGVPGSPPGLSDVVAGVATLEDAVLSSEAIPMYFMLRGNSRVTDVHASQFDVHFRKLAERFDLIIVDSPPVNLLADVQLLAGACQAVLLVARSFMTSRQALEKAVQDLQRFNVIGSILNANEQHLGRYGRYY